MAFSHPEISLGAWAGAPPQHGWWGWGAGPHTGLPMYHMHRIYCATPWELEEERGTFYAAVGEFNATHAMPHGVLYVPVSLGSVQDKRPYQYALKDNIRACRHY